MAMFRISLIFISFLGISACANQNLENTSACKASNIDPTNLVTKLAEEKSFPGMAVAVGKKGEVIWTHGYGLADVASSVPIDPHKTKFRIGSTSKALTGFVLSVLHEKQTLDLDQPINLVLTEIPSHYEAVNIRQLAGHLGGVRHYQDIAELGNTAEYPTSYDALDIFIEDALIADPSSTFEYSTYGYTLISAALEELTQKHFLTLMSEVVFEPLEMTNTIADTSSIKVPDRTQFYYYDEEKNLIIGDEINMSNKWAGGGFLASAADLARFGNAHFNEEIIAAKSRKQLWASQKTSNGTLTGYGIGWFIEKDWVQHPGGALGGTTLLRIYPEYEIVIALTANLSVRGESRFGKLPDQLFQCFSE